MAFKVSKVEKLFDSASRIWNTVRPIDEAATTVLTPFEKLYGAGFAGPIQHAHDNLKTCVEVAVALKKFTDKFKVSGKWMDGGAILENFTQASAGRKTENKQAVEKLTQMVSFFGALKGFASIGKDLTNAAKEEADLEAKLQLDTVLLGGNLAAAKKASNDFTTVTKASEKILPGAKAALDLAKKMTG